MNQNEMKQIFKNAIKGLNFMTPNVIRYEDLGHEYIAEISEGSGMLGWKVIYGITVIGKIYDDWLKVDTVNKCLGSLEDVEAYIRKLKIHINLITTLSLEECLILIGTTEVVNSLDDIEEELQDILKEFEDVKPANFKIDTDI